MAEPDEFEKAMAAAVAQSEANKAEEVSDEHFNELLKDMKADEVAEPDAAAGDAPPSSYGIWSAREQLPPEVMGAYDVVRGLEDRSAEMLKPWKIDPTRFVPGGKMPMSDVPADAFERFTRPSGASGIPSDIGEATPVGAIQGLTLGFAPELAGAVGTLGGTPYEEGRDAAREKAQRMAAGSPAAYEGGKDIGALPHYLAPSLTGLKLGGSMLASGARLGLGALEGALYSGATEAGAAPPGQKAQAFMSGAPLGAVIGLIPGGAAGVGKNTRFQNFVKKMGIEKQAAIYTGHTRKELEKAAARSGGVEAFVGNAERAGVRSFDDAERIMETKLKPEFNKIAEEVDAMVDTNKAIQELAEMRIPRVTEAGEELYQRAQRQIVRFTDEKKMNWHDAQELKTHLGELAKFNPSASPAQSEAKVARAALKGLTEAMEDTVDVALGPLRKLDYQRMKAQYGPVSTIQRIGQDLKFKKMAAQPSIGRHLLSGAAGAMLSGGGSDRGGGGHPLLAGIVAAAASAGFRRYAQPGAIVAARQAGSALKGTAGTVSAGIKKYSVDEAVELFQRSADDAELRKKRRKAQGSE